MDHRSPGETSGKPPNYPPHEETMKHISRLTYWYRRRSEPLIAAMLTNNPQVAEVLARRYSPFLGAEESSLDRLEELNQDARLLEHAGGETVLAEQRRLEKDEERGVSVVQRDIFDGLLRAYLRGLRERFARTYGRANLRLIGLSNPLPENPLDLVLLGKNVLNLLGSGLALPPELPGIPAFDREATAGELNFPLTRLEAAQRDVELRKKEAQTALVDLRAARLDLRRVYTNIGRRVEGSYRLAGFDDLADMLRETARQVSEVTENDGGEPSSEDPSPEDPSVDSAG